QFFASIFDASTPVPAVGPTEWDVMTVESVNNNFNGVRLQTGTNSLGAMFDEIRIGESWADVAVGTSFLLGDFNGSSAIDPGDFSTLMSNLYTGTQYSEGDIDFNGIVDLRAYIAFRPIYTGAGFVLPAAHQVPEPTTLLVVATLL